jgi:DNA transformation protein
MSVSPGFETFALDQLGRGVTGLRSRRMFGGVGIYSHDIFFALLSDDTLYLKVDDTTRGDFEARGMGPFRPFGEDGETMQYYQVPDDLLENPDDLAAWAARALEVARRIRGGTRRRPRRRGD